MQMQRVSPPLDAENLEPVAAVRHVFQKAAVQNCQNGRNPNRSYAAPVTDVSHADFPALHPDQPNWRFRPIADEVGGSCSTGIECAKVQLSMTARKGATQ